MQFVQPSLYRFRFWMTLQLFIGKLFMCNKHINGEANIFIYVNSYVYLFIYSKGGVAQTSSYRRQGRLYVCVCTHIVCSSVCVTCVRTSLVCSYVCSYLNHVFLYTPMQEYKSAALYAHSTKVEVCTADSIVNWVLFAILIDAVLIELTKTFSVTCNCLMRCQCRMDKIISWILFPFSLQSISFSLILRSVWHIEV